MQEPFHVFPFQLATSSSSCQQDKDFNPDDEDDGDDEDEVDEDEDGEDDVKKHRKVEKP